MKPDKKEIKEIEKEKNVLDQLEEEWRQEELKRKEDEKIENPDFWEII